MLGRDVFSLIHFPMLCGVIVYAVAIEEVAIEPTDLTPTVLKMQQAGADAVIGSHPHILQGVEQIDGRWVVHSTGNFAFPSARNDSSYSAIFLMTVTMDDVTLEAQPIRIVRGRPVPADSSRAGILDDLTDLSFGYDFTDAGTAIASQETGRC